MFRPNGTFAIVYLFHGIAITGATIRFDPTSLENYNRRKTNKFKNDNLLLPLK